MSDFHLAPNAGISDDRQFRKAAPMDNTRKFYRLMVDPSGGGRARADYEWSEQHRRYWMVGPHRPPFYREIDGKPGGLEGTGFPLDLEVQTVFCDLDKRKPLRDFEESWPIWIVSDRARRVLDETAAGSVEYFPLHVRIKKDGVETDGPVHWWADVVRCEDAVDEPASYLEWEIVGSGQTRWYDPTPSKFVFRADLAADARLFRLNKRPPMTVCDGELVTAIKQAKLTGVRLKQL